MRTLEEIKEELRKKAIKRGKMGTEIISITLNKEDVDIETLCDTIRYEFDGDCIILSCEAEIVFMTDLERYVAFMCNIENSHRCDCCPESNNKGNLDLGILPCGQYGCWVDAHCN